MNSLRKKKEKTKPPDIPCPIVARGIRRKQPERPFIPSRMRLVVARLVQFGKLLAHVAHGGLHCGVHLGRRFCPLFRREVDFGFLVSEILGTDRRALRILGC